MEKLNNEPKKRGRPSNKSKTLINELTDLKIENPFESPLITKIKLYLLKADYSFREMIVECNLSESIFENNRLSLTKAVINRIAVLLAHKLDQRYGTADDSFPASENLDSIINELYKLAGIRASEHFENALWDKLEESRILRLGYVSRQGISESNNNPENPVGSVIDYSEKIAAVLGFDTKWVLLKSTSITDALQKKEIDAMCPSELIICSSLFNYSFSDPCSYKIYNVSALIPTQLNDGWQRIDDIPSNLVEILYIDEGLGSVGVNFLRKDYKKKSFKNEAELFAYFNTSIEKSFGLIPIFIHDSMTSEYWRKLSLEKSESKYFKRYPVENISINVPATAQNAFAINNNEKKLLYAVNLAIQVLNEKM